MRQCWNRQTGTFEGRVSTDVRVQVPFAAPSSVDKIDEEGSNGVNTPFEPFAFPGFFSVKPLLIIPVFYRVTGHEPRHYRTLSNKLPFSESAKRSKTRFFQKIFHKV